MIWIGRFVLNWIIIATLFYLASKVHFVFWWVIALVIGSRQHALIEVGHMASHRLVFRNKFDDYLARASFYPVMLDLFSYRKFHLNHHKYLGVEGKDPEVALQKRFSHRWQEHRIIDSFYDSIGLTIDESIAIIKELSSPKSLIVFSSLLLTGFYYFGIIAILWPLALLTGLPVVQRLRARTEHNHLNNPGTTIKKDKPSLIARLTYLPHGVWKHYEHHNFKF